MCLSNILGWGYFAFAAGVAIGVWCIILMAKNGLLRFRWDSGAKESE